MGKEITNQVVWLVNVGYREVAHYQETKSNQKVSKKINIS